KKWVYDQFDVGSDTINRPGDSNSGVIRMEGTNKGLAMKTDCNGRYVYLNPRRGGQIAVAEAARNVVCSGAKPLAISNCLNFGNPYNPEMYWTFKEALAGMSEACKALNTPVTGGNVSFYNENPKRAIYPTPVIGMLGVIDDIENDVMTPSFKNEEDIIFYIGSARSGLGGSEYLHTVHNLATGNAPELNLEFEVDLQKALLSAIKQNIVNAVHDISDGGLAVTLAEMSIFSSLGANIDIDGLDTDRYEALYSEAQSGVVVSCRAENKEGLKQHFEQSEIPAIELGKTGSDLLTIKGAVSLRVSDLQDVYESALPEAMDR